MVAPEFTFQVKVINPQNQGGYVIQQWASKRCDKSQELKTALAESFHESIGCYKFDFGYIQTGHGFKGKKLSIESDADMEKMYLSYLDKPVIRLWVKCLKDVDQYSRPKKRGRPDDSDGVTGSKAKRSAGSGYDSHMKRMDEVEEIYEELSDKHSENFTSEQIRAWAHMISMKKHSSYEIPPDKRFFQKKQEKDKDKTGVSPGKRIDLRSKCIDQLEKWHTLLDLKAITIEEYKKLQQTIIGDIQKF
jgi:hypothetical protein